jgi:hypothetical protein
MRDDIWPARIFWPHRQDIRADLSDITSANGSRLDVTISIRCSDAYFVL